MTDVKRMIALISILVITVAFAYCMNYASDRSVVAPSFDGGDVSEQELMEDSDDYTIEDPEGVAEIIVKTDLEKTHAENAVSAVVFDYRGFDTIGESFILLAAIAGSHCILRGAKRKKEVKRDEAEK
ncbi:MAG: hypothetical protein II689_03770 [Firmicutes bacterium]|jgi:hypothetical protein|nr:hypothetical protein [Bacillota bacterium]